MKTETRRRYSEILPFFFALTSPLGEEESYEGTGEGKKEAQNAQGGKETYRKER